MGILLSHIKGNANVKAATYGLIKANMLEEFHVTIASLPGSLLDRIGGINPFAEIRRRSFDPMVKPFIHTWPWLEAGRLLASKSGFKQLIKANGGPFAVDAIHRSLDKHVAARLSSKNIAIDAVYCYEDSAVFTFRKAKQLALPCLYDLPIGYWRTARKLLETEKERWPDWVNTMPGLIDSDDKLSRKDEELKLADRIFVASSFTAGTLGDFPGKLAPVEVIPYGFPPVGQRRAYDTGPGNRRLKLLFVGSLSQRKGIADLFAVANALDKYVELTVVGKKVTDDCAPLNTALAKHKYFSSLPNNDILKLMRDADLLIFPSLFEGFGLVICEAMSQGTPVITTERTAGPDLITHGEDGWLINAGSTISLQNAIEYILCNPKKIRETGQKAYEKASSRPWEIYGLELANAVKKVTNKPYGQANFENNTN